MPSSRVDMPIAGFDWDEGNREKCTKHGVSLAEIESLFKRDIVVLPSPGRSRGEIRYKAIGKTFAGRHVFVVFTLRDREGHRYIRAISARHMHQKEVRHYEEANPHFPN